MEKLDIFFNRMKDYLNDEDYQLFKDSFNSELKRTIRFNPSKISNVHELPFELLEKSEISDLHYYVDSSFSGNHPYHLAGTFYMQEASAGSAVEIMHVKKHEKVLDMCSAPGGKTTQIAGYLDNTGVLVANEYISSRAQILLSNIERMGQRNIIILNEDTKNIANQFPLYFDKILVDAPCSGEGMFHKKPQAIEEWSLEHVQSCALRQYEIICNAYECLKEGGEMVYSTCTFSKEENEFLIEKFILAHPDMEIIDADVSFGRPGFETSVPTNLARRIYPMDGGDGHFVCRMRKIGNKEEQISQMKLSKSINKQMKQFLDEALISYDESKFFTVNDKLYYFEYDKINIGKLKLVRYGILCGEMVKDIFKPHHHFFMAFGKELKHKISFDLNDKRLYDYLRGNEIHHESTYKGYIGICVDEYVIGFGKISNGQIKNHYPKGLRLF